MLRGKSNRGRLVQENFIKKYKQHQHLCIPVPVYSKSQDCWKNRKIYFFVLVIKRMTSHIGVFNGLLLSNKKLKA